MPEAVPLGPTDPTSLGTYEVVGRLGASQRGNIYLARNPAGNLVTIHLLNKGLDEEQQERFFAEAERLRQVSAFYTAQVLETGTSGDQPYIVREHIEGPTLQEAVESSFPLRGAALYRLAIGTMTALVAIHQAGIVHRDLRPGTVVLAKDGPRVIDYGMAPAVDSSAGEATRPVTRPSFHAPEQFDGQPVGPAADVFAWGAMIVYAASGHAPFEAETMSATIERIRHGEPDLHALDQHLSAVVADCLAKDRRMRPSASLALLRLLEHAQIFTRDPKPPEPVQPGPLPTPPFAGQTPPPPPPGEFPPPAMHTPPPPPSSWIGPEPRKGPSRVLLIGIPAVATALIIAGIAGYLIAGNTGSPGPKPPPPAAKSPAATPTPPPVAEPVPPEEATAKTTLPGTGITLHENPSDPVQLSSYIVDDGESPAFVRDAGGEFKPDGNNQEPSVSPGGAWLVRVPRGDAATGQIQLVNRKTGAQVPIDTTVKPPNRIETPRWSADGRRLLLTAFTYDGDERKEPAGFVMVDVTSRKASFTPTEDEKETWGYRWGWNPTTVSRVAPADKRDGIRLYGPAGKVIKEMDWVGRPEGLNFYSPSFKRLLTVCPQSKRAICVWTALGGERQETIKVAEKGEILGWWNDEHVIDRETTSDTHKVVVRNLKGEVVRTLAEIPKDDADRVDLWFTLK